MKISPIVSHLRQSIPWFKNRVDGILDYSQVPITKDFGLPCAFVVPEGENVIETTWQSGYEAECECNFSVYVYIPSQYRGSKAFAPQYDEANKVKTALIKSLAGQGIDGYVVLYDGYEVVEINVEYVLFKVDFKYGAHISTKDTAYQANPVPLGTIHVDFPDSQELGNYVPGATFKLKEV